MNYRAQTLEEIAKKGGTISSKNALVGFDGFVDKIIAVVDKRTGQGQAFSAIDTITEFANRIGAAAGRSTNIELFPRMEKLGGNGPIMANALLSAGMGVKYIGALGEPSIHPVFAEFAAKTNAVTVCDPGVTHALEFHDGKIMLGTMASLDLLTYPRIVQKMGEGAFLDALSRADLIALVNWTMIPNMTSIYNDLLDRALPNYGPREAGRTFFFDLADPEKRPLSDIQTVLGILKRFRAHGQVILGLNLKEALQVDAALGFSDPKTDPEGLKQMASRIRAAIDVTMVVIHPTDSAACATRDAAYWVQGSYCEKPLITTGAGDHFNAGFTTGAMLGMSPAACLTLAVTYSGYYVRTAKSPSLGDAANFIRNWA
ncbi:MAG: PfkB family carbohydrate kinase [Verrucomicrobiota bacterium]|nr:PfkB family carbohydrate kinase [Verrucomicrobiota bacterium]